MFMVVVMFMAGGVAAAAALASTLAISGISTCEGRGGGY
jgi:hypothetical protein